MAWYFLKGREKKFFQSIKTQKPYDYITMLENNDKDETYIIYCKNGSTRKIKNPGRYFIIKLECLIQKNTREVK